MTEYHQAISLDPTQPQAYLLLIELHRVPERLRASHPSGAPSRGDAPGRSERGGAARRSLHGNGGNGEDGGDGETGETAATGRTKNGSRPEAP
jgi:hypothetical protein